MSFIGNVPAEAYSTVAKDTFSGNGSTTDFTLSLSATTNGVEVFVENVQQEPTTAYTISGTTLSFTAAPTSGTNNIYVIHRGPAVQQVTPPAGVAIDASTVTASGDVSIADKIVHTGDTNTALRFPAADTVTVETGGSERVRVDSSGNVGIGTTSPSEKLHVIGDMLLDSSANTVLTMTVGGTSNDARIDFNNGTSVDGGIVYDHNSSFSSEKLVLRAGNNTDQVYVTGGGNLQFNSGYGSVATAYGCRAWVNFDGTGTVAIRDSGNVSSITDQGTGDYSVNFSSSLVDSNFATNMNAHNTGGEVGVFRISVYNSSGVRFLGFDPRTGSLTDTVFNFVSVVR